MEEEEDDILFSNSDEVNLPFELSGDYTIESAGEKQVPVVTTHNARETCTIACCVTSEGKSILPLLIFKSCVKGEEEKPAYKP